MVWAILWFGFVKKTGQAVASRYWLTLLATGIVVGLVVKAYQDFQQRTLVAGIESTFTDYLDGDLDIKTQPVAGGAAGQIEAVFRSNLRILAEDSKAYSSELNGTGFDQILDVANIRSDPDLSESKRKVEQAQRIVSKYRDLYSSRVAALPGLIDKSNLSDSLKTQLKAGVAETALKNTNLSERYWESQKGIVTEFGTIIDLLARARGAWKINKDQFEFERQADIDTFNAHLKNIQTLTNEEDAIRAEQIASMKAKIGAFAQ